MMQTTKAPAKRLKIAATINTVRHLLHGQHILDRFLDGYGWNGQYHHPQMDLVALYVDQKSRGDLSWERALRHPQMTIYPTIHEALTRGTGKLDVDGIVLVAEDGNYPDTERGFKTFPRYPFFEQIVAVFKESGRSVPVFVDKHLSYEWDWARQMYDWSQELKFPLMAGSSLPVTWRLPSVEMPLGSEIEEAMCVGFADSIRDEVDSYDFHCLEVVQCMVERRKGGETGVEWVEAFRGDKFWNAYDQGVWSKDLVTAALTRSHYLTGGQGNFTNILPTYEQIRAVVRNPLAYHFQHRDGLKTTIILFDGLLRDFNFAAKLKGQAQPFSCQMYLPIPDRKRTTLADFFSPLVHHMEQLFLTGKPAYPVERTLLDTGILIAGVNSLYENQTRKQTPHLNFAYKPNPDSTFWRS
jgi:hypothetical protein